MYKLDFKKVIVLMVFNSVFFLINNLAISNLFTYILLMSATLMNLGSLTLTLTYLSFPKFWDTAAESDFIFIKFPAHLLKDTLWFTCSKTGV